MTGIAHGPFTLTPGARRRRIRDGASDWATLLVAAVGLVAVLVAILSGIRSQPRGLRNLPDEQRLALFTRTFDELRQFCGEGRPKALDAHCRELASFAGQFDECRDECKAIVSPQLLPRPTR